MTPIDYHRPESMEEALRLIPRARPLAGGTSLAPRRMELGAVVDLQALQLDRIQLAKGAIHLGATCKLQSLIDFSPGLPQALADAARLEAPFNLRNMATVAGTIVACDGRSPLVTVLLAMDAVVRVEPGGSGIPLDSLLDSRPELLPGKLITSIDLQPASAVAYQQVARTPKDRPIVCAALGRHQVQGGGLEYRLALGGFGTRPVRVPSAELALQRGDLDAAVSAAADAYSQAEDAWASAAYRAHVAAVLTRRLAQTVAQ